MTPNDELPDTIPLSRRQVLAGFGRVGVAAAVSVDLPGGAQAAPKDDAETLVAKFLTTFSVGGNADALVSLFSPDALLWGTTMPDLGTDTNAIREYFARNFAGRPATGAKATAVTTSTIVLSDTAVLVAGRWQTERADRPEPNALRYTFVLNKRGDRWFIAHLHSSTRPAPTA